MSLQKFRADTARTASPNGSVAWVCNWMGGPTLALVRSCPATIDGEVVEARTVYVQGEADTFFTVPAAVSLRGKTARGSLTCDETGYEFNGWTNQTKA